MFFFLVCYPVWTGSSQTRKRADSSSASFLKPGMGTVLFRLPSFASPLWCFFLQDFNRIAMVFYLVLPSTEFCSWFCFPLFWYHDLPSFTEFVLGFKTHLKSQINRLMSFFLGGGIWSSFTDLSTPFAVDLWLQREKRKTNERRSKEFARRNRRPEKNKLTGPHWRWLTSFTECGTFRRQLLTDLGRVCVCVCVWVCVCVFSRFHLTRKMGIRVNAALLWPDQLLNKHLWKPRLALLKKPGKTSYN